MRHSTVCNFANNKLLGSSLPHRGLVTLGVVIAGHAAPAHIRQKGHGPNGHAGTDRVGAERHIVTVKSSAADLSPWWVDVRIASDKTETNEVWLGHTERRFHGAEFRAKHPTETINWELAETVNYGRTKTATPMFHAGCWTRAVPFSPAVPCHDDSLHSGTTR